MARSDDRRADDGAMSNMWPPQLEVGSLRFVRSSAHYDATVEFYRDLVGLPVIDEFQAMTPEVESGWVRLKARIEPPRPAPQVQAPKPGFLADLQALIARPAVAALAAAQMAALAFGGWLVALSQPAYHALGSAPEPAGANVIVIFRSEATVEDVRDALKGAGASIVSGPTAADAYLLHVEPKQRQTALARLQGDDDVQMAEPIDGGSP